MNQLDIDREINYIRIGMIQCGMNAGEAARKSKELFYLNASIWKKDFDINLLNEIMGYKNHE